MEDKTTFAKVTRKFLVSEQIGVQTGGNISRLRYR
jgi:hypothetical protein